MGKAVLPSRVKLFAAMTFNPSVKHDEVLELLKRRFGDIDFSYGPIQFIFTDYYEDEMGGDLKKTYMTFAESVERESLAAIKVFTNEIEDRYCREGRRLVNVDPGYVARDKLVLASTKDFYHRIYLSQGIYAEVTLHYRKGMYRYFSWTFPDYKEQPFLLFLEKIRAGFVRELRL
jgi:hypothetical protein